jgi:hypothetical protein
MEVNPLSEAEQLILNDRRKIWSSPRIEQIDGLIFFIIFTTDLPPVPPCKKRKK